MVTRRIQQLVTRRRHWLRQCRTARRHLGCLSTYIGPAAASRLCGFIGYAKYWMQKMNNPNFHSGKYINAVLIISLYMLCVKNHIQVHAWLYCVLLCWCIFIADPGGARDGCRLCTPSQQSIVEFHAWQLLKYNPRYATFLIYFANVGAVLIVWVPCTTYSMLLVVQANSPFHF